MSEIIYDKMLNIKSSGIREWDEKVEGYNRYEATPYKALEKLFKNYSLETSDQLVDFGCGRGRVAFYIHHRFQIPVTGIEGNDVVYEELLQNKTKYKQIAHHITAPIEFKYEFAENYQIKADDNLFYFFNPFSVSIFEKVINNILLSYQEEKRTIEIILYYPIPKYQKFLQEKTPFKLINEVDFLDVNDRLEKFLIYQL